MTRAFYLVHNLNDAAVERRTLMLRQGGAEVYLAGFRRGARSCDATDEQVLTLGRTHDANLLHRAMTVSRCAATPSSMRDAAASADLLLARNLEMLVLAARIRRPHQRLVYECLDIHRTMLGPGPVSGLLRGLERRLLRGATLLLTSSPAFVREYFLSLQHI